MFYMFLATGFEETEALATLDVMRRAKLQVQTVGVSGDMVTSSHKETVKADIALNDVDYSNIEGVILPGGMPGTTNLESTKEVCDCVKYCFENKKNCCGNLCRSVDSRTPRNFKRQKSHLLPRL